MTLTVQRRPAAPRMSPRVGRVCMQFGIEPQTEPLCIVRDLPVYLRPGSITLISGPSAAGKSSLLQTIEQRCPRAHAVHRCALTADRAIVDAVGECGDLPSTLQILTACALGEPRLWLRTVDQLSEGEQFRARLARCLDLHQRDGRPGLLLCDEFGALLHRRVRRAIAYNLRKLTTRNGLTVVLAGGPDDMLSDLQPDQHIRLDPGSTAESSLRRPRKRPFSLRRGLVIERAGKQDYARFKTMHYRSSDELGFVDCVFVLREKSSGDKLGIVVYAHPPLELALRNEALGGRFKRNARLLNSEVRMLRRLVVHPDVRGCGLGHYLVTETLPLVGVRYVECLTTMGSVTPVFEKAGMARIGQCPLPARRLQLLEELRGIGADPFGPEFHVHVRRRPRVRQAVMRTVCEWYRATTGEGRERVARQSPQFLAQAFRGLIATRPVYYLWQKN